MKVLVVEDSPRLRKNLEIGLTKMNFTVDMAADGEEALSYLSLYEYDVLLLDIMLPKRDGFDVLKQIKRKNIDVGVLMLTARDDISDRVQGLEMGADDYLCKPFAFEELVARIKSVSRRRFQLEKLELIFDEVKIDLGMKLIRVKELPVNLTPTEYSIIEQLAVNAGKVLPFEKLQDKLRSSDKFISRNALEVNVSNIRKKINDIHPTELIMTKRGSGYYIEKQ